MRRGVLRAVHVDERFFSTPVPVSSHPIGSRAARLGLNNSRLPLSYVLLITVEHSRSVARHHSRASSCLSVRQRFHLLVLGMLWL